MAGTAVRGRLTWQVAAVPISGLTAWQGLFDHAELKTGQTVLIHGDRPDPRRRGRRRVDRGAARPRGAGVRLSLGPGTCSARPPVPSERRREACLLVSGLW